ncbi:MAG: branched-chain amino acid ABC transporter permease, partial [bacterium]|nr:branched-chain amino acid ABC transporter permease [bacterium]
IFAGFTGGEIGLAVPAVISVNAVVNYDVALAFMVSSALLMYWISHSPLGLILQAIGQDRVAAEAMGFNVVKYKLFAFGVSAFFSGLAGAFTVFYLGTASVGTVVAVGVAIQVIIAAVVGGRRTIVGAIIGAVFLILAGEVLRPLGDLNQLIVAAIALFVLLAAPDGFVGMLRRVGERRA